MQLIDNITKNFQFITRYRRWPLAVLMLVILMLGWTASAHADDYSFRKRITIDHTKVGSTCSQLQDFPVLIHIQNDPDLKAAGFGGHVSNPNGYDIVFEESDGNKLDHEVLRYNGSSGSLLAFVRLPEVSSSSDTIFYIHYGNPSISDSQEKKKEVWKSAGYEIVLHLQESGNGSDGEYEDSSGNDHHGTGGGLAGSGNSIYTPDRTNGLFGYAQDFDNRGSAKADTEGDLIRLDAVDDHGWNAVTVQVWINPDDLGDERLFGKTWGTGSDDETWLLRQNSGKIGTRMNTDQAYNSGFDRAGLSTGSWFLASATWDSSDHKLRVFLNGNQLGETYLAGNTMNDNTEQDEPTLGNVPTRARSYDGQMQEARVSSVARPACWLKTEYNNQISPATFYSVGPEENTAPLHTISASAGGGGIISPVGNVFVKQGGKQEFKIIPASGYEISDVEVDGGSIGAQTSHTFDPVLKDHTISVTFIFVGAGDDDDDDPVLNGCGETNVGTSYQNGFVDEDLSMLNTALEDGYVVLKTGYAAINHEKIVIPFDQEIFVNMLYTAGYGDIGYLLLDDVSNPDNESFKFHEVPIEKRHGFFRHTSDDSWLVGDGVFDTDYGLYGSPFPNHSEAAIAAYDDGTGRPFIVDWDGEVTPKDMRKSLGFFAGGTEIVIWMMSYKGTRIGSTYYPEYAYDNDEKAWDYKRYKQVYYNKHLWNWDWWTSCEPEEGTDGYGYEDYESGDFWYKVYRLGEVGTEGECNIDWGWLQDGATERLKTYFNLEMADSAYFSPVTPGEKFHHFIVGAPKDDPNLWLLGIEQNNSEDNNHSDVDCNDMVFMIERKTGGMVELDEDSAISSGSEYVSFTGVSLQVWDYMPCVDDNEIKYEVSIDNGVKWLPINGWDQIYESDKDKKIKSKIETFNWEPGSPAYTYRTARLDFSGEGMTGHQIRWRAFLVSQNEKCEPKIMDLAISATVMGEAEVSRAGPVVKANVLYSGSYDIIPSGSDHELRGHLKATRIYDPTNPDETNIQDLWDAGEVLNNKSPDDRNIYFPNITVVSFSEQVGMGLGPGSEDDDNKTFSGMLTHHPALAASVTITDAHEKFTDKHTDVLEGNLGGTGKIDRFSGEFRVTFNTAPADGVPIMAHYKYYVSASDLLEFKKTNVTADMLGIDDSEIIGKGYTYDFDGDGNFNADDDSQWLINWVRGYKDGASTKKDWLLGAVDHSVQAVQTPPALPSWYYGTATTRSERESFWSFVEAHKDRPTVVYNGARDGMMHAFDGGTFVHGDNTATSDIEEHRGYFSDYGTGEELWAFIPANLIPRLKNNVLGGDQAFVDASPALADVYVGGSWKTVLLCAQGNGGDTIFALDVTDPENPTFMWEFADPDLFRSRSSPSIGKIGRILVDGEAVWVACFVSGKTYNAALLPSIYMINVADGSVVERVMLDADASGVGGVPSGQPSIVDSDGNGYIDRLYIGTDKGFLYKVNIPDDPDKVKYGISNCVINRDFTDSQESPGSVPVDQRYHPIYGSPVVIVDNGMDSDGAITYDIKIMFGTGDSPYFDEDIDMANTRYHFFVYRDQAKKGVCDDSDVFLDWFYELPEGHRIFASAFAAAGQVYFGTATSETEDPCDTPSTSGLSSLGDIYSFDIATGVKKFQHSVGNTTITPIVVDKHLYVKSQSAEVQSFGDGKYNNAIIIGGFPKVEIRAWHEIF